MALKKINYTGSSKVIIRLCEMVNQLIDGGGGGGSTVSYTQTLQSGTKTGAISIDGVSTDMYAPTPPVKVSDLTNDSGFITNTVNNLTNYYLKSETYTQAEVDALISAIVTLNILVVQTLPTQDISTTTIYLVPKQTAETQDIYDEYIYVNNAWEHIGTTQIDLSNYYTKTEINTLLADKVDKVTGKQLSTEDFTSALKTKLDGIASGAEVNVQSDWSQSDNTADDYIKNKPTIPTVNDGTLTIKQNGTTVGTFSANQSGNTEVDITGGGGATYTEGDGIDISAQNVISVDTTFSEASTRTNIASGDTFATILGKIKKFFTDLKAVAFSGDYTDLNNTPTIPTDFVSKTNGGTFNGFVTIDRQDGGADQRDAWSAILLGNSIAKGTAGHSAGYVRFYGHGSNYTDLSAPNSTANHDIVFPNKDGTVALTSDIPDISTKVSKTGDTMTGLLYIGKSGTDTPLYIVGNANDAYIGFKKNDGTATWGYLGVRSDGNPYFYDTARRLIITDKMVDAVGNTVNTIAKRDSDGYVRSYGFRSASSSDKAKINGGGCYIKSYDDSGYTGCFASSFTNMSSKKFKENIKPITEEEAEKILDVEVVTYDYKEDAGIISGDARLNQRGVIAEQVEDIIPSVITYEEEDGKMSPNGVDYSKFVPYLIKMVQMQQKEIDNLKAEISALKK